jgi:hypothetical protein
MADMQIQTGEGEGTLEVLRSQGLQVRTTMKMETPELPSDITEIGDEDLMVLFSKLTAYSNFLATQMACAMIDERDSERELDLEESIAFLQAYGGKASKDTMTLIKAQVAVTPKVIRLKETYSARYNYRKLIEVMVNNVERDTALVSRELTRRTSGLRARSDRMFT